MNADILLFWVRTLGTGNYEGRHRAGTRSTQLSLIWHKKGLVLLLSSLFFSGARQTSSSLLAWALLMHEFFCLAKARSATPGPTNRIIPDSLHSSPLPALAGLVTQGLLGTMGPLKVQIKALSTCPFKKTQAVIGCLLTP